MQEVNRALARGGAEVHLLSNRLDGEALPGLDSVHLHPLGLEPGQQTRARASIDPAANEDLRTALEGLGGVDLVYERFSLGTYAAMEHARDSGVPGILEINGPRLEKAAARGALADRGTVEEAAERAVAAASAVFAVSRGVADYVREKFGAGECVHVVSNGVDPGRFPPALLERRAREPHPFTVGFVGTFKPHHGLDTLVEAFALLKRTTPEARLMLVGDGRQRPDVEARLAELGLSASALLTGEVSPVRIPPLMSEMDVGVAPFPARRYYSSPLKVFEYLAAGLPVVASGVEQVADMVVHGETGLLCEPDDPPALCRALELLASDAALRTRLGSAGRTEVLARHSWDAVAERILTFVPGHARSGGV
jgi:glycosyltransferase involved in cell wall biosynthesis